MIKRIVYVLLSFAMAVSLCSCGGDVDYNTGGATDNSATETDRTLPQAESTTEPVKFSAEFNGGEVFVNDTAKRAAEHIDPYIKQAVVMLNTVGDHERRFDILDCDYSQRPQKRDDITDPLTLHIYDTLLESAQNYGDYYFNEDDYNSDYFFGNFVDASDAFKADYRCFSLYTDTQMGWKTYEDGYYMPGGWLDSMTDDRDAVKAEVDYYNAVVDRIIEKMPQNMTNYDKCCYFAFVIASVTEYDYDLSSMNCPYPVYPALVQQNCVCQGYAESFYELCKRAGISCWYCRGKSEQGDHAWNRLETEEGYIYMDLTWYDDDEIKDYYRDGWFIYLFMTEEDLAGLGHIVEEIR